jgi:hypothetical protein
VASLPTPEALALLRTLPEPLSESERVAPPRASRRPREAGEPEPTPAPSDTGETRATAEDSTSAAAVPVPSPTRPLGDVPGARVPTWTADSSTAPPVAAASSATAPAAAPPGTSAPRPAAPATPDSCWRVQVAAPPERDRADRLRAAAESQLLVPWVIEPDAGLFKVRTRDCLGATAADSLKRRAARSGFEGAFRFRDRRR